MTDATTADKLAAWELIEAHRLCVCPMSDADGFNAFQLHVGADAGMGTTPAAAVKDWAEAAGVPWPSVNVVPMFAAVDVFGPGIREMFLTRKEAEDNCEFWRSGEAVPCEVVIGTETEATP